ncbi:hypothetical protein SAMN04488058_1079 [Deinococcus reticulitermitis]|uniref:Uncharacterized protein n=1 Tax=Deinococcus reticulitermitis TaxID=856736 RepID=A0A1H6Y727_9DEIO|nr:hypothetical protein [Deinococcus reticulitermitis]SEJ37079.1 hypothetical protein SAMN04488058_1079 [Deinococcus reticulitermitis]
MRPALTLLSLVTALALFGVVGGARAGGAQAPTPVTSAPVTLPPITLSSPECRPDIGTVTLGSAKPDAASARMAQIFAEDQAARQGGPGNIDWNRVAQEDERRREEVLGLLKAGRLARGQDFYHAALVFQHGDCSDHYFFASQLARAALARSVTQAGWLYAATFDRWQLSQGQPQKYGTQFVAPEPCAFRLAKYDPDTTDAERSRYGVPPLAAALAQAEELSAGCRANRKGQNF